MRAAVLREHGSVDAVAIEDAYPDPDPGPGEAVVEIGACALNYHDLFTVRGMPGVKVPLPVVIGIDFAGTIARLGPDGAGWKIGDRVLVDPLDRFATRLYGETRDGGLAQRVCVPLRQLIPIPDSVSVECAACLPVAFGTAHRMMLSRGTVHRGEKVLILGASGGVGTCCVQLAKMVGAEVIACASTREKLDRLLRLGTDHVIDYSADDFVKGIHQLYGKPSIWGGGGVDVVVNFTGGDTWVPSLRCLTSGGRLLTCGATAGFEPTTDLRFVWTFELSVIGSTGWERSDLECLLSLVARGAICPVVDRIYPLAAVREALTALEQRRVFGKVLVDPRR